MAQQKTDSVTHLEQRAEKIRTETKQNQTQDAVKEAKRQADQAWKDLAARQAEDKELSEYVGTVHDDETREQLLERIRKLRDEPVSGPVPPIGRHNERMQQEFTAEQEAGRAAVAKAQAEMEHSRELRLKMEAEQRAKEGTMTPVHHPNPSQTEMFPTVKATLK